MNGHADRARAADILTVVHTHVRFTARDSTVKPAVFSSYAA